MRARWSEFADEVDLQDPRAGGGARARDARGIAEASTTSATCDDCAVTRRAARMIEESLALFHGLGDERGIARALITEADATEMTAITRARDTLLAETCHCSR